MLVVLGLDGKPFKMDIRTTSFPIRSEKACKSRLQYECGRILKKHFGMSPLLEEVSVPNHRFYLDFFLPNQKIVVEVHGRQHDEFVPFFHKTKADFKEHQNRDERKKLWCEINDFSFYEVRSPEELKKLLGIDDESPTN